MKPAFIVQQKLTALVNKYTVFAANENGEAGKPQWYVQQKRLAMKEKVTFYSDEAHTNVAFTFRAEKVMDVHGRYIVEDAEGKFIGAFRKDFGASLTKSTWHILDGVGEAQSHTVAESNAALAMVRRYAQFVPVVGSIAEIVTAFLKYHFDVVRASDQVVAGRYTKLTLFRDTYLMELDGAARAAVDIRVWTALAVALDALQSR